MLAFLRQRKRSWVIIFFVTIIVLVFILWGVGSYINEPGAGVPARVNGEAISPADFAAYYQRVVDQYRALLKEPLTEKTLRELNLNGLVLQELIQRRLLLQEARRLGLRTSDEELMAHIANAPEFQDGGRFNQGRYLQILRANRTGPAQFESERRADITIQKLYALIGDSVMITENEMRERYRFEREKLNLSYIRLSMEPFLAQVETTADDVQAYYKENQEALKEPLRVRVEYTTYPFDRFASEVRVTDEEIKEFYEKNKETKFHRPKNVRLRQIFFRVSQGTDPQQKETVRLKAEVVLREAQQGKDFAQLAKSYSDDPSAPDGGDMGSFSEGQMLAPLDRAAFALKKGQISGLIETPMGYHILKAEETIESRTKTLKEVRAEIVSEIRDDKGKAEAREAASSDREKALAGSPLSQLAKERGLSSRESGFFGQFEVVPEVGPVEEFNRTAFSLSVEEIGPVVEGRQAYYLMKVQERKEPSIPPLAEARAQIEKGLREKKATELMEQKGKELLAQLKTEKNIQSVAKKNDLEVRETGWFLRNAAQIPEVGPLEALPPGGIAVSMHKPIPDRTYRGRGGVYLFAVKDVQPADMERFDEEKKALEERMLTEKRQRVLQKFVEDLRAKATIEVEAQALERALG